MTLAVAIVFVAAIVLFVVLQNAPREFSDKVALMYALFVTGWVFGIALLAVYVVDH